MIKNIVLIVMLIISVLFGGYVAYHVGYVSALNDAKVEVSSLMKEQELKCAAAVNFILDRSCPDLRNELLDQMKKEKGEKNSNEEKFL